MAEKEKKSEKDERVRERVERPINFLIKSTVHKVTYKKVNKIHYL
jgi:hypothetical protein